MASFNRVVLLGNLTRDPEVKYTTSGMAVCEISLAMNHSWKDSRTNEKKEEVTFVEVTLFGRTAEIAGEYLTKGRPALIEGRLKLERWHDRTDGKPRSKLIVIAESLQLVGGRRDGDGGGAQAGAARGPDDRLSPDEAAAIIDGSPF